MANDPWEQFLQPPSQSSTTPASGADPWAQFTKPPQAASSAVSQPAVAPPSSAAAPASAQGQDIGQLPIWRKPADVDWPTFELAHLKSALPYFGTATKAGDPTAQAAALGSGLTAGATNLIPGAKEAAASLDPQERMILEGAGYTAGPGALFGAARAAAGLPEMTGLSGVLARGAAGAGEGAITSGAGTAFEGGSAGDIAKAAATGGVLGALAGAPGGRAAVKTAAQLKGEAQPVLNALDATQIDNLATTNAITQAKANVASAFPNRTSKEIATALAPLDQLETDAFGGKGNAATFRQVMSYPPQVQQNILQGYTSQYNLPLTASAGRLKTAIDNLKGNGAIGVEAARPLEDLMSSTPAVHPSGASTDALSLMNEGKARAEQYLNMGRLEQMVGEAKEVPGTPDVGTQAKGWFKGPEGRQYYPVPPPGQTPSPFFRAWQNLGNAATPPVSLVPTFWDLKHAIMPFALGATGGLGLGVQQHHDPSVMVEDALMGGLGYYGLHRLVPAANYQFRQLPALNRAIGAAGQTFSTGQYQAPARNATLSDLARGLAFGPGASGAYATPSDTLRDLIFGRGGA